MVANKFGNLDKDRLGKEVADKPLPGPGSEPGVSAMVGGISNRPGDKTNKETGSKGQDRGSRVPTPAPDGIPPCVEGGFRNKAMEHKR